MGVTNSNKQIDTDRIECDLLADIHHIYRMTIFLRALCESRYHSCSISMWPGSAV